MQIFQFQSSSWIYQTTFCKSWFSSCFPCPFSKERLKRLFLLKKKQDEKKDQDVAVDFVLKVEKSRLSKNFYWKWISFLFLIFILKKYYTNTNQLVKSFLNQVWMKLKVHLFYLKLFSRCLFFRLYNHIIYLSIFELIYLELPFWYLERI